MHERVKGRFVVIWSFIHEMFLHDIHSFTTWGHTRPLSCSSEAVTSEPYPSSPTPLRMTHSWCSSHFATRWYQWRTGYCASFLDNMRDHNGCNERANAFLGYMHRVHHCMWVKHTWKIRLLKRILNELSNLYAIYAAALFYAWHGWHFISIIHSLPCCLITMFR